MANRHEQARSLPAFAYLMPGVPFVELPCVHICLPRAVPMNSFSVRVGYRGLAQSVSYTGDTKNIPITQSVYWEIHRQTTPYRKRSKRIHVLLISTRPE